MNWYRILFLFLVIGNSNLTAQEEVNLQSDILRIFLDCQTRCDLTYFKQEIGFVNFMQDRQRAEVFLQLLRQSTGAGGSEFSLLIQGLDKYAGSIDTIIFYTEPAVSDNVRRDIILVNIKKAILPFIVQTSLKDKIEYVVRNDTDEPALNTSVKDPWNYWSFRIRNRSFLEGQSQSNFIELNNSISANRTTEESKINFFVNYEYSRSRFDLGEGEKESFVNKSAFGRLLYVHSIDEHWSLGGSFGTFTSTFRNVDIGFGLDPTVEYNIFPYSESSIHQFTIRYKVGPSFRDYTEITVFDKLEEWYWEQELQINFSQIQNWGTLQIELQYENYLHDFGQLRIGLNPELEWNIIKGFNIDLFGNISYVSNLRNIQKSEVDPNSILLQTRQLDTNFEYFIGIGLSYRFGSAYNNIVNTRF